MRRLLYLAALSMVVLLLFASAALAQGENAAAQYEPTPATAQYDQYTPAADQYTAPQQPAQPQAQALPATGGPALLLSAGVLLLGAGLLGMKLVRRS